MKFQKNLHVLNEIRLDYKRIVSFIQSIVFRSHDKKFFVVKNMVP